VPEEAITPKVEEIVFAGTINGRIEDLLPLISQLPAYTAKIEKQACGSKS
jgi:hypothetical protein